MYIRGRNWYVDLYRGLIVLQVTDQPHQTVLTDYDDPKLMSFLRKNVVECIPEALRPRAKVIGHIWGQDPEDLTEYASISHSPYFIFIFLAKNTYELPLHAVSLHQGTPASSVPTSSGTPSPIPPYSKLSAQRSPAPPPPLALSSFPACTPGVVHSRHLSDAQRPRD